MNKAWYIDDDPSDPTLEHHKTPCEYVPLEDLYKKTGVELYPLNVKTFETDGVWEKIKKARGYTYQDELICTKGSPGTEEKLKVLFTEHLHTEEETRFIYEGASYFDVRDAEDKWIRIHATPGDLLVVPAGIYHRFTLDLKHHVKMKRFFQERSVWCGHNRPADEMACRQAYVETQKRGFVTA